ncbi:MAG: branched chain amino acid ABC transporter substrate-binding protein [Isosphaera sp.]|nr:branched chain amino acid ABC transporter substrate-binding protein [Isosphaera sp.]
MDRRTFLAASAGLVAVPAVAQKKETITIVSSMPRTGAAKGQTDAISNAIKLAIADREKDFPVAVEYWDYDNASVISGTWEAKFEAGNAREAAADKDVVAYIGPYNSGAAKVSMPILNEAGLVQVSPACTWPGLTKKIKGNEASGEPGVYRKSGKITFCRVVPHDFVQGAQAAAFVAQELKAKTVYVLDDKELYGSGVADAFEVRCKDLGVKVLGRESVDPRARDYRKLVAGIRAISPDVVYFGGTSQSGGPQVAKDLKAAGVTFPLVVPDGCYEEAFIQGAGKDAVNGRVYATIGGVDPSQLKGAGADFVKRYKEKYKADPEAYAVYGYEAAAVVLEAIRKVGKKDREAIRQAVLATKDFDKGILGKWSFDADGDTSLQQVTVSKVEDGKFKPVKVLDASDGKN